MSTIPERSNRLSAFESTYYFFFCLLVFTGCFYRDEVKPDASLPAGGLTNKSRAYDEKMMARAGEASVIYVFETTKTIHPSGDYARDIRLDNGRKSGAWMPQQCNIVRGPERGTDPVYSPCVNVYVSAGGISDGRSIVGVLQFKNDLVFRR